MAEGCVLSIGNFDGVHVGHQAILRQAQALAAQWGRGPVGESGNADAAGGEPLPVVVATFEPLPLAVLKPELAPPRLSDAAEREQLLRAAGADRVVVMEPTQAMLAMSPKAFLRQLCGKYAPRAIVEGPDFRFGHQRAGDVRTLAAMGKRFGYQTQVVAAADAALDDHSVVKVSSSITRWLLGQGRVVDVGRCLGRPYTLSATVVEGDKRGRTIGFPTMNLDGAALRGRMLPADGVYAGVARLSNGRQRDAAVSIGVKPTFEGHARVVEAHLLDFEGDLYGQTVALEIRRWLRGQQRFAAVEGLKAQLARDVAWVRRMSAWAVVDVCDPRRAAATAAT